MVVIAIALVFNMEAMLLSLVLYGRYTYNTGVNMVDILIAWLFIW